MKAKKPWKRWAITEHWLLISLLESGVNYTARELASHLPGRTKNSVISYMRNNYIPLPNAKDGGAGYER